MRNFNFILLLVAVFTVVGLSGCGPYPTEQAVEVKNNETAFVVPLEGDSKSKQAQFMSIEYLEKAKVATKRIVIPLRKRSLGRAWFDYEWIPLARVIVVDRSPVTREWLDKEGIKVESLDSVGFTVGVNCTGMIREEDAAKFLYYYPGNSLADVMNKNVKGFIQNVLAREFGSRDLSVCQKEKKNIVLDLAKELETHFAQYGITISNVGIADGMSYDNAEVQKTIDAVFVNETRVKQAEQEREAQKIINEKELSIAQNERLKAEEFAKAAEAQTKMVELKIRQMEAEARLESAKRFQQPVSVPVREQMTKVICYEHFSLFLARQKVSMRNSFAPFSLLFLWLQLAPHPRAALYEYGGACKRNKSSRQEFQTLLPPEPQAKYR